MSGRVFIDTNVLVYADDAAHPVKRDRARARLRQAIRAGDGVVSTQVLQEYFVVATRKLGLSAAHARRNVELFSQLAVVEIQLGLLLAAIDQHRLHQISFWDALILQAASSAGCDELWTEDLHAGAVLSGVRIVNPFAA